MTNEVTVTAIGRTHVGMIRDQNEDFFLIGDIETERMWEASDGDHEDGVYPLHVGARGPVLVVCDGLGGAAAGEVAAKLAAEIIWDEMSAAQATADRSVYSRILRRAVRVANRRVWEAGRRNSEHRGMGTTVSAAVVAGDTLLLAQVGDSRAYIARGSTLVQVTRDQSVVSALVRAGRLRQEDARHVPGSNVILQALGIRKDIEVALSMVELKRDDRLLLCSDGVHGSLSDDDVRDILDHNDDLSSAADELIEAVLDAGAPDNVTAVLARFSGDGLPARRSAQSPDEQRDGDHRDDGRGDDEDEAPRFTELDPMEEGERALNTTSVIVQRLAARVGIGEDPGPPVVPATAQFTALKRGATSNPHKRRANTSARDSGSPRDTASEDDMFSPGLPFVIGVSGTLTVFVLLALLYHCQ